MIEMMALDCHRIAQANAPFDTGNLRFNAIQYRINVDGFTIVALYPKADYIHYLNDGTMYTNRHSGFWSTKTALETSRYVNHRMSGNHMEANALLYDAQAQLDSTVNSNLDRRELLASQVEDRVKMGV